MSEILHISLVPSQLVCLMGPPSHGRSPEVLAVAPFVPCCGCFVRVTEFRNLLEESEPGGAKSRLLGNSGLLLVTESIDLI